MGYAVKTYNAENCSLGVYYNYRHYNPIDEGFASYRYEHGLTEWFKWF